MRRYIVKLTKDLASPVLKSYVMLELGPNVYISWTSGALLTCLERVADDLKELDRVKEGWIP